MSVEENKAVIRDFVRAMNEGDFTVFERKCGPGYVYHGDDEGKGMDLDLDGHRQFMRVIWTEVFTDARVTINEMVAEGDTVASHMTFVGMRRDTGEEEEVRLLGMSRFTDGKVVEDWEHPVSVRRSGN